jgi:EAL domain-containing protein (putative c-di-GMP-specific phosphodiesterase class I)/FixJ family two-component response regulator
MSTRADSVALVVEDSRVQREHMVRLLHQAGYGTVLAACDGIDALRVLDARGAPVELVVTDLDMPGMDGVELMCYLGARRLTSALVVASARASRLNEAASEPTVSAVRHCLLGMLLKPVRAEMLETLLGSANGAGAVAARTDLPSPDTLRAALDGQQFLPYFCPRVDLGSGALRSVDVQPCWQHPDQGLLPASRFLHAFQDSGLAPQLAYAMAAAALEALGGWHAMGLSALSLVLRLPGAALADRGFVDRCCELVHAAGVAPATVHWEFGEPVLAAADPLTMSHLAHLSLRGFGLELGGYRCGQTSLQQLARCPIDVLRIERVMLHEAAVRPSRQLLLQQMSDVARTLDLALVAEGVELRADWMLLRALGVELAQGPLLADAMPGAALASWYRGNRRRLQLLCEGDAEGVSALAPPVAGPA